jgi:hypothetical protein
MRHLAGVLVVLASLLLVGVTLAASSYQIPWSTIGPGGGLSRSASYTANGGIAVSAGHMGGGSYAVQSGFWSGVSAPAALTHALVLPVVVKGALQP